jgi:hypothetical protein
MKIRKKKFLANSKQGEQLGLFPSVSPQLLGILGKTLSQQCDW